MSDPPKPQNTEGDESPEVRYVHKPPPLWPPPKFVWAIALVLLGLVGLLVLRFWIALRS